MSTRAEFLRNMGISEDDIVDPAVVTNNFRKGSAGEGGDSTTSAIKTTSKVFKKPSVVDSCMSNDMLFRNGGLQDSPSLSSNKNDTLTSYANSKMPGNDDRNKQKANFLKSLGIDDDSIDGWSNDANVKTGDTSLSHSDIIRQRRAKFKSEVLGQGGSIDGSSYKRDDAQGAFNSAIKRQDSTCYSTGNGKGVISDKHASQEYAKKAAVSASIEEEERRLRQEGYRSYDHHRGAYSDGKGGTYETYRKNMEENGAYLSSTQRKQPPTNYGTGRSETKTPLKEYTNKNGIDASASMNEVAGMTVCQIKDLGNKLFEQGDYRKAIRMYSTAIDRDPTNAALYSNRSAAYLVASKQMGIDTRAMSLRDSNKAIELRPTWYKGYSRKGDALFKLEQFAEAVKAYEQALRYDEGNVNIIHSLGEARNANGGLGTQRGSQWSHSDVIASEKDKSKELEETLRGKSARQMAEELRSEISATVGSVAIGIDFKEMEMEKFRSVNDGVTSSLNSTTKVARSGHCGGQQVPTPPSRKGRHGDCSDDRRAPISAYDGHMHQPASEYGDHGKRIDTSNLPPEFNSDAAAAYQERLLEEYRRKKKQQGC
eukprot:Tbor_TRINITY_DN5257_c1_g1::TRINITY_DN5257_c1_g1_i1::g.16177::m.16177/K09553/STIP1; stress-induced-phosphoprotein 1